MHQGGRVGVDLVGEVGQRRAAAQPDDRRAVAAGNLHATDRRRLHVVELLTLRCCFDLRPRTGRPPARPKAPCGTAATAAARPNRRRATGGAAAATGTTGTPPPDRHRRDDRRRPPRTTGRRRDGRRRAAGTADRAERPGIMPGLRARRHLPDSGRDRRDGDRRDGRAPDGRRATGAARAAGTRHALARARTGCCPDAGPPPGRGMPWLGANGLLPGRGAAGHGGGRGTAGPASGGREPRMPGGRGRVPPGRGPPDARRARRAGAAGLRPGAARPRAGARPDGRRRAGAADGADGAGGAGGAAGRGRAAGARGGPRRGGDGAAGAGAGDRAAGAAGAGAAAPARGRRAASRSGGSRCRRCRRSGAVPGEGPATAGTPAGPGRPDGDRGRARTRLGDGRRRGGPALGAQLLAQLAHDGRLDGRGRRPDELAELVELGHDDLALDAELLGELVDPDLCHFSPVSVRPGTGSDRRYSWGLLIAACSSRAHRVLIGSRPASDVDGVWLDRVLPGRTPVQASSRPAATDARNGARSSGPGCAGPAGTPDGVRRGPGRPGRGAARHPGRPDRRSGSGTDGQASVRPRPRSLAAGRTGTTFPAPHAGADRPLTEPGVVSGSRGARHRTRTVYRAVRPPDCARPNGRPGSPRPETARRPAGCRSASR